MRKRNEEWRVEQITVSLAMTELLEKAVGAVRGLPADVQDELASLLLQVAGEEQPPVALTREDSWSLNESIAQSARGEYVTDEQVATVWAKHGL